MTESSKQMVQDIAEQAKLFDQCAEDLIRQCRTVLGGVDVQRINKIYVVGCGDSYCAALCLRDMLIRYTGVYTEACQALEFSRYLCPRLVDSDTLVLCISSSGKVSRTVECALRAKQKGAVALGLTADPQSPLAKAASATVLLEIPVAFGFAPGTKSYLASMLVLLCTAVAFGNLRGALSDAECQAIFGYISQLGKAMEATANTASKMIEKYVQAYFATDGAHKIETFHVLGSGPNWGTAVFATYKLLEAAGFDSICQGIEEWAHTQYFTTRPGVHTLVIAPKGAARDRAMEILQGVTVMDGKKVVIGEEGDTELARCADIYIPICGLTDIKEEFSPLVYAVPVELLSVFISECTGGHAFDFERKPWRREENMRQIQQSNILPLE